MNNNPAPAHFEIDMTNNTAFIWANIPYARRWLDHTLWYMQFIERAYPQHAQEMRALREIAEEMMENLENA